VFGEPSPLKSRNTVQASGQPRGRAVILGTDLHFRDAEMDDDTRNLDQIDEVILPTQFPDDELEAPRARR